MALDFSPITSQPSVAERFFAGQREAQQNALMQQQLLHAQQQNALAQAQMEEYKRGLTEQEQTRNYLRTLAPEKLTSPETLAALATQYGKTGVGIAQNLVAGMKSQAELKKVEVDTAAHRLNMAKTKLEQYNNEIAAAPDRASALQILQRRAADPDLAGTPVTQVPIMAQAQRVPEDPAGFDQWKRQQAVGMAEWVKQSAPKFFQQRLGNVDQIVSISGTGGAATLVPGSTAAVGISPYQQAQLAQGQARLAQGAARLGISAAAEDPFGLLGLPRIFGTGLPAQPSVNALVAPQPVAPAAAPAATVAVPAKSVSVSGQPAATAVQTAIQQGLTGPDFLAALPAPVAKEVAAIIDHRAPPPGRFTKKGEQLTQLVMQADPTYDATQYGNKAAAEKQFTSGQLANSVRSFNVAQDHLTTLGELSAALKNNDTQAINRVAQFFAQQTGSPAPTNFDAAKRIVADEIVKAVIGGRGALGDRKAADETLSRVNSPEQLIGVIDTYKKLINGQLGGLEKQYEVATGKTNFKERFLTSGAKAAAGIAPGAGAIPQAAIDALKAGKGTDAQFDEIFGAGAAARVKGR